MGRTIKRVPLDFDHNMGELWPGYINTFFENHCHRCLDCDGSGYSTAAKKISDDWYGFNDSNDKWSDKLTQDEVDELVNSHRLREFSDFFIEKIINGQVHKILPAELVNLYFRHDELRRSILWLLGHDGINQSICVSARCNRLGIQICCLTCNGTGNIWDSEKHRIDSDNWMPEDPPLGIGWQLWETITSGSPVSPVCATKEELADWLGESTLFNNYWDRDQWLNDLNLHWK